MGLFTPIYMKPFLKPKQREKALAIVAAITDPDKLCRIALEAPDRRVCEKAVEGLSDQGRLRRVAGGAKDYDVQKAAVRKLTDPDALIALGLSVSRLFEHCLERLSALGKRQDLAKLFNECSVGRGAHSIDYVKSALRELADQEVLERVATGAREGDVRLAATRLLERPAALIEVARRDQLPAIRRAAAGSAHLTDAAALASIAAEDRDAGVRSAAVANPNFTDVAALSAMADDKSRNSLRWAAALRLTKLDPDKAVGPLVALLSEANTTGEDMDQLKAAIRFLEDRYRRAGAEEKALIAALPNRRFGTSWNGPCWHEDASIHFDIPR